ncbi:glycosyltransferase family 4 protein [Halobacillus litoralis]|uniref:glycosyltransferase family 4 protein n=1 Tax=Halobacillus litoralis TaxID=45668 RepID=UPI001367B0CE|nr:glycosyltransferase family 1 protein [Halobacillus litoralis]MYL37923.1 glycosyltransferase [Halobacillus litoralis]
MKAAIFTDTYVPQINGVAKTLKKWTDFLEKKQMPYRLFAPNPLGSCDYNENIQRFKSLPFWLYPECRLAFPCLSHIRKELDTFKPDIIHIATPFNMGWAGHYYARKLKIPLVGSYHTHFHKYLDFYKMSFLTPLIWNYMRRFHQPFKRTFVPSIETKKELLNKGLSNISIWSRGVDSYQFRPEAQSTYLRDTFGITKPFILTYVGRLAPEKGLDVLMKAAATMPREWHPYIHWVVVGEGPLYQPLQHSAPSNMTFTGYKNGQELSRIYAESSLLVFPSATETFGNVVLEALASGTPAIVADSGGVKEIVQHGQTGWICRPGDPASFVAAVEHLLRDPLLLQTMSGNARDYALTRSWEAVFNELLREYQAVVEDVPMLSHA